MIANKIDIFYANDENLGDWINPILIERLFHIPCKKVNKPYAQLIAMGSLLQRFSTNSFVSSTQKMFYPCVHVWGSGFIRDISDGYFKRNMFFSSVRGCLSKKKCEQIMKTPLDIVVGDPGLLFSCLFEKTPVKKYTMGIIPHKNDYGNPLFQKILNEIKGAHLINTSNDPIKVLQEIAACDSVIASSLHGLIAADSFGIPNKWIQVSTRVEGNGYKFHDYYSAFGLSTQQPLFLRRVKKFDLAFIQQIYDDYKIKTHVVKEIQEQLLKSFPFKKGYT